MGDTKDRHMLLREHKQHLLILYQTIYCLVHRSFLPPSQSTATSSGHTTEEALRKIERINVRWCAAGLRCSELPACKYCTEKPELPELGTRNSLTTSQHTTRLRKKPGIGDQPPSGCVVGLKTGAHHCPQRCAAGQLASGG